MSLVFLLGSLVVLGMVDDDMNAERDSGRPIWMHVTMVVMCTVLVMAFAAMALVDGWRLLVH